MCKIELSKGLFAIVDDEDYEFINSFKWCASNSGRGRFYAQRKDNRKTVFMHRLIMKLTDKNLNIDHINHNTLDNRKINLRICSKTENARNKSSHPNSSSKFLGVSWDKSRNKWKSCIYINKKCVLLGRFNFEMEAAKAYDNAAKTNFKEFANLNFK